VERGHAWGMCRWVVRVVRGFTGAWRGVMGPMRASGEGPWGMCGWVVRVVRGFTGAWRGVTGAAYGWRRVE